MQQNIEICRIYQVQLSKRLSEGCDYFSKGLSRGFRNEHTNVTWEKPMMKQLPSSKLT